MITLSENFRALFYAPFYVAQATSAFAREGVDVSVRSSAKPGQAAAALEAGEVEVMWGGPLRVLLAHDADAACDVVCFCDVVARDPFFIIGREPRPDFRPADLVGLRLGAVSEVPTPWLCLQDDIRRDGADPEAVRRVTDGTMAQNAARLRDGALDAVQLTGRCAGSGPRRVRRSRPCWPAPFPTFRPPSSRLPSTAIARWTCMLPTA
jgi:NitT/TauT family transport system substrate-binding protein